jgi:hypothetical protein
MNSFKLSGLLLLLAFTFSACEDPIDVDLKSGESQLVVDGLLFVNDGPQKVILTLSQPYFDNNIPQPVTNAAVNITTSGGKTFNLTQRAGQPQGHYITDSITGETGEFFVLEVQYGSQKFLSSSRLVRGWEIDTLFQEFRDREFGNDPGTYLNLQIQDSVGVGDFGWLRYSLNGIPNRRPGAMTIPADAGFAPGNADGLAFIYPIRNSINQSKPYLIGDTIGVELISFDESMWIFMNEVNIQINNSGLFADPIANVRSLIVNADKNSKEKALGSFSVARISRAGVRVK